MPMSGRAAQKGHGLCHRGVEAAKSVPMVSYGVRASRRQRRSQSRRKKGSGKVGAVSGSSSSTP